MGAARNLFKSKPGLRPTDKERHKHAKPTPPALSDQNLESDCDYTKSHGQGKTIGSVLRGADIQYLSDREFDESFTTNYPHQAELERCIDHTIEALNDEPYLGRVSNARVMGDAMGLLMARHGHKAPMVGIQLSGS